MNRAQNLLIQSVRGNSGVGVLSHGDVGQAQGSSVSVCCWGPVLSLLPKGAGCTD